jgi:hypothetical protein
LVNYTFREGSHLGPYPSFDIICFYPLEEGDIPSGSLGGVKFNDPPLFHSKVQIVFIFSIDICIPTIVVSSNNGSNLPYLNYLSINPNHFHL